MTIIKDFYANQLNKVGYLLGAAAVTGLVIRCFAVAEIEVADTTEIESKELLIGGKKFSELSDTEVVQLLSDEDYKIRELAYKAVWSKGKVIIPTLESVVDSDDPELTARASMILRNIRIGISADTPKHIVEMVKRFQVDGLDEKEDILQNLYREKQYNQMLFMLSEMKNKDQSKRLYERFGLLGHLAARESLAQDNIDGALELLDMVPQTPATMRSKAFILSRSGKLETELEKQTKRNQPQNEGSWLTALMIEQDDRSELKSYAQKHDLANLLGSLDLLDGKIEKFHSNASKRLSSRDESYGLNLLKLIYDGGDESEITKIHQYFYKNAKSNQARNNSGALKKLYMTGANDLANELFKEFYWNKAFVHLNDKELPREALAVLKITDDKSLEKWGVELRNRILDINVKKKAWDVRNIGNYIDDLQLLFTVAKLYHTHGAHDKSASLIKPLFAEMYKEQKDRWFTTLNELIKHKLHELVIDIVLTQANDGDIERTIGLLYDDTQQMDNVWDSLSERKNKTIQQNFKDMAYLMGLLRSPDSESDKLMSELIQIGKKSGPKGQLNMNASLYAVTDFKDDSRNGVKFIDSLLDNAKKTDNKDSIKVYTQDRLALAAMNLNWKKMDEMISKDISIIGSSSDWLVRYSVVLRKLGKEEMANTILDRAILLTVGLESELSDVANELNLAEDLERSHKIYEKILLSNSVQSTNTAFIISLLNLSNGNSYYVKSKQWAKAASTAYAFSVTNMVGGNERQLDNRVVSLACSSNFNSQFSRGMMMQQQGKDKLAKRMLRNAHQTCVGDGSLADFFYPALKETDYNSEYNAWVEESNQHLLKVIKGFPNAANTRNTLAWILGKTAYKVDEGIEHSTTSLKLAPNEAAYLDTMGELWFAKKNRAMAIKWGKKAVSYSKRGRLLGRGNESFVRARTLNLMGQLQRFKTQPFPKK